MLVTDKTTSLDVKAEITSLGARAMRQPQTSDVWVTLHAEIYRLQSLLDGILRRERDQDMDDG